MPKKKEKLIFEDSDFKKLLDAYKNGNSLVVDIIICGLDCKLLEFTKSQAKEFIGSIISNGVTVSPLITDPSGIDHTNVIRIDIDCNMLFEIISNAIKEDDINDIVRYTIDTIIASVGGVDNIDTVKWGALLRIGPWSNKKRAKKIRDAFIKNIDKIYKNEKCRSVVEDFISRLPVNFKTNNNFKDVHTRNTIEHLKKNYPSFFNVILGDEINEI